MLIFCILNSDCLLRTFKLKFLLFQKVRLIIFNTINIPVMHYLRYKSLKLSTRTPVGNVSYLMRD